MIWNVGDAYYRDDFLSLPIYGEVVDSPYPEDREELDKNKQRLHRAYSKVVPEGEMGIMGKYDDYPPFTKIERGLFEKAKRMGWPDLATVLEEFDNDYA